ncbi:zinc finger protein 883 [Drosophila nasuta]|uniref:zinc finger protein 883 n=1 Tax=Drosophila nasuta TaxID=42062 RepID=UPI00295F3FB7|nr:zinc finger protein 883 [Drosophila nasuta]
MNAADAKNITQEKSMGFKQAMLQRSYEMAASPSPQLAPGPAAVPQQVTDFSISRILGGLAKDNDVKRTPQAQPNSNNILDLSRSNQDVITATLVPGPTSSQPSIPVAASNVLPASINSTGYTGDRARSCAMLPPDFLAMASATKFYAQFFPQLLPAYAAAAAAAGITTPPTSPYHQPQPQHQKRYFAPYVINSQSPSQPKLNAASAACSRVDCLECLDYYKQFGAGYKLSPLTSPAASSVSSSSSTQPARARNCTTNISLTTVTNVKLISSSASTSELQSKIGSSVNTIIAEEISYKCRICDKVFGCSETLQAHEKTHKSPRYECSDCGKGFSQLRNYKYHLSVHRGTKEFAAECPECGKTFNDKGYLSSHMKIHRNRKEYECPYCPKSFNQRVAFNMHVRIHTGVKPHKCAECGKRFSRKMLLKQHMRTHSGEKPYQCSVCGKSFADRSNMTLHHRLHSGIKPFSCPLCPKAFTKKHHLKTHLNYHTGCKPYVCPHPNCNQAFTQSSNMRTHAKKCQYRPLDSAQAFPVTTKQHQQQSQQQLQLPLPQTTLSLAMAATPSLTLPPTSYPVQAVTANSTFPPAHQTLLSNLRTF